MNNHIPTIAIIGGGFCGTLTLIQLSKQTDIPLNIVLINKDNPNSKGIAFSTYNSKHVLNVPAAKMSAFPDDPDNFINWIKSKPEYENFVNEELNDSFLPYMGISIMSLHCFSISSGTPWTSSPSSRAIFLGAL